MVDKGSRRAGRVHEAEGLGRSKLLGRGLSVVEDRGTVGVGK